MGAWGPRLLENDTALDILAMYREDGRPAAELFKDYANNSWAVLGLADHLLSEGVDITPYKETILASIAEEKQPEALEGWTSDAARLRSLNLLEQRIHDPSIEGEDSRGLFEAIADALGVGHVTARSG